MLSQSGSFWWAPQKKAGPGRKPADGANWVRQRIDGREALPLRFYVEAGVLETQADGEGIRDTGRALYASLRRKGYEALYHEPPGGHDWYSWRGTLPEGLEFLAGRQPADDSGS